MVSGGRARRAIGALAAASAIACGAAVADCGGDNGGVTGGDASLSESGLPDTGAICPNEAPKEGTRCASPEGTTCAFGACGGYATCAQGLWRVSKTYPGVICPSVEPIAGSACPVCFPAGKACDYISAGCTDPAAGSAHSAHVTCSQTGRFIVELGPCPDAGADAAKRDADDASSDVKADAGDVGTE